MREARLEDAEALEELENQLFQDNCFGSVLIKNELEHGRGWVIESGDRIVAYLHARIDGEIIDVTRVGVLAEVRRIGHATNLLNRAVEERPIAMLTVRKDNARAIALYRKFGFTIVGHTDCSWMMQLHRA